MNEEYGQAVGQTAQRKDRCEAAHVVQDPARVLGEQHAANRPGHAADADEGAYRLPREDIGGQGEQVAGKALVRSRGGV